MAISTTYSIRPATEEDLPAILNLYGEAGLDGGHRMDLERARDMLARFADYPDYRLFVVADTVGKPIATYALLIMDNVAHNGQPIAIVEQIAVNRSHQRQGQQGERSKEGAEQPGSQVGGSIGSRYPCRSRPGGGTEVAGSTPPARADPASAPGRTAPAAIRS